MPIKSRRQVRRLTFIAVTALLCLGVVAGASAAGSGGGGANAAEPGETGARQSGFVRHAGRHWVWFGPRSWRAGYGTYGITILGRVSGLDLGFSTTFCAPGQTVAQSVRRYFAAQRRNLQQSGRRLTSVSRITRITSFGPRYFRQKVVAASRRGGIPVREFIIFDYEVNDETYCYQRSVNFGAPRQGFNRHLRTLFQVFNSLAYSGPGAYEDGNGVHGT